MTISLPSVGDWLGGRFRLPFRARPAKPYENLKIALISDDLTRKTLQFECHVRSVSPANYRAVFERWRPDLLMVESTWRGYRDAWRYRIASYPDVPERDNRSLAKVVSRARDSGIPCIFWNREDGVHFDRFIASARLFDRVLTVDENMIPAYRAALGPDARIKTMMFAASSTLHRPTWEEPRRRAAFVGSYSTHVHDQRRVWQDHMFEAAEPIALTIYDRNSRRRSKVHRYPDLPWIDLRKTIPHQKTAAVYRAHLVNLNVNTITDSRTAFSRRLVEILACGGFVVTNDTLAVREHFAQLCLATDDPDVAKEFFERVYRNGLSSVEKEMRGEAATLIHDRHTWGSRIPILLEMAYGTGGSGVNVSH